MKIGILNEKVKYSRNRDDICFKLIEMENLKLKGLEKMEIKSFKIIAQPMSTRTRIQRETAHQRKLAKQNNKAIDRIEVLNAYEFFTKNRWAAQKFKDSKKPSSDQKIIILYFKQSSTQQTKSQLNMQRPLQKKIAAYQKATSIKQPKTIPFKQPMHPTLQKHISPLALQQRITLTLVRTANNTHLISSSRCISFRPLALFQRVA